MKLTKTKLKRIIKEELNKVLKEEEICTVDERAALEEWKAWEDEQPEGLDKDDLYDWLNSADGTQRYADDLKDDDGLDWFIKKYNVEFPITDFNIAYEVLCKAKEEREAT
jgi:hypothetical protein